MSRPYRGESANEWLGITCPEDCAPLSSQRDEDADYEAMRQLDVDEAACALGMPSGDVN